MTDRSDDRAPRPLPREWLPDPHPPQGAAEWDAKVARIMAAADPEIHRLGTRRARAAAAWWPVIGLWWKPAATLAAAATALLLLTERPAAIPEPPQGSLSLSLVATDGDPAALWEAFGIPADPVLALIAFEGDADVTGQDITPVTPATPDGRNR